jgi:MFS family permease
LSLGIFAGWIDSYTNSTIIDIHKTNSRKYIGYLHASFCIGAVSLPFLIHFLMTSFAFNWRAIFFVSAFIILIVSVRFLIVAKANKDEINNQSLEKPLTFRELKGFMKDKYYLLLVMCYAIFCLSQNGLSIWIFHYTKTVYPHIEILASLSLSTFWLAGFFSRIFYHKIKIKPMKLFIYGISISIISHIAGIMSGNPFIFLISTFIVSLSGGLGFPLLVSETLNRYSGNTSMALTGLHFFGKAGAFIMPLMMGAVSTYNIHLAMMMTDATATISVIIAIIILFTKDKRLTSCAPRDLSTYVQADKL